ncbi:ABC transporter substrate-binding protein, partial [Mesorhizobium sp.]|uniref:ABC transporter substrate-binding protein n=1 Tax=Mesorhizobium sp. TaxID=1871066 RepID=UPI000FE9F6CB
LEVAYSGQAEVSTGPIAPGVIGHREKALVPPEGNLAKAKEFLEAAGVGDLAMTIDCSNDSTYRTIAEMVQAQLSQIGITVQINAQESGSFWTTGMESEGERWKSLQLIVNDFSSLPDPHYATAWFVRNQVGIWNWERFRSERFDELFAEAATIEDSVARATLYREMQDLMEESGAYRFLTHGGNPVLYRTTKMGAATRPDGYPLYIDFEPA